MRVVLACVALFVSGVLTVPGQVVINEIMYHPSSELTQEEYLELYNTGATPVDLQGWTFSKGIGFTFTNSVTLPAAGFLVVAANPAAFHAKYPTVANYTGPWTGTLNNSDETIRLQTSSGSIADEVFYADEGDYALRRRAAASYLHRGWEWYAEHDGLGKSLERVNPLMDGKAGANWASSTVDQGTPGAANSVYASNIAPLIVDVAHYPLIPSSTDSVTVTARVRDEQVAGKTVTLNYRYASSSTLPSFSTVPMYDDGAHGDNLAGDGLFGAVLPARTNQAVIEFYVRAVDGQNLSRTWPAPALDSSGLLAQVCNALYQVDDGASDPARPSYRLIMTHPEYDELYSIPNEGDPNNRSHSAFNGTFVAVDGTGGSLRYLCSFRNRGEGSRSAQPPNYRVGFASDRRWNGQVAINLNSQFTHSQVAGSAIALSAGLVTELHRAVQVRINGLERANAGLKQFGSYVHQEVPGADMAANHWPEDPNGNFYRAGIYPYYADLSYKGTNIYGYTNTVNGGYSKTSNKSENDWSDLIHLTDVLANTPDATFWQELQRVANVAEWVRYFAVFSLTGSQETSLGTGYGDDYSMYRGMIDTRFKLVGHDWDTILGQGDTAGDVSKSIFRATETNSFAKNAAVARFLKHPEVAPLYYAELAYQLSNTFAPSNISAIVDRALGSWVPDSYRTSMKTFATNRAAAVWQQIPQSLTVNSPLPLSAGYRYSTVPSTSLSGKAPAVQTRSVLVNGAPAAYIPWQASWSAPSVPLNPGLNRVLIQALALDQSKVARTEIDIWYDDGSVLPVAGTILADTTWSAAEGPYSVTGSITVPANTTLTIDAGTSVYLGAGASIIVNDGGRLMVNGTDSDPVRLTVLPGSGVVWGGIRIYGSAGSPETQISHTLIEGNNDTCIQVFGGSLLMDNVRFGTFTRQYLSLEGASFLVKDCVFPSGAPGNYFELVHGAGGIKSGGRGLFLRNYFGTANSISGNYNDVVDFTGGQRPGPIVQFINNVFAGSGDDLVDLDGTDAWIEGNIFMHAHKNGSTDTSSAISGGSDSGQTSEITVIGNIIYDCDHAALAKQGNFYTFLNNTIVHQTRQGGLDTDAAVVCLQDNGMTEGAGIYLEGNIIWDAEKLTRAVSQAVVTYTNNLLPMAWNGPGGGNVQADPLFNHLPNVSETQFGSWSAAQVMRQWLSLRQGSPAQGVGPNGRDMGGIVSMGASISGEPASSTPNNPAVLRVGTVLKGNGIPVAGFPNGSGYTHYKWRLDGQTWSTEFPVSLPITFSGLSEGDHRVEVVGRRDSGLFQDAPELGPDALVSASKTWTVNATLPGLRLNEILARNVSTLITNGERPDLIEIVNAGASTVSLAGKGLTDDPTAPYRYIFPPGTSLAPGACMVLYGDTGSDPARYTGFGLSQSGDRLFLFDSAADGGSCIDSVSFGPQVADLSIGRLLSGGWGLCRPTFGNAANVAEPVRGPQSLVINEWLASGAAVAPDDFIELFNPEEGPVALGNLYLTDSADGTPARDQIIPLSYIAARGWCAFKADGNVESGPEHLSFHLSASAGTIGLFDENLAPIDVIWYGPQQRGVSQGRSPDGSDIIASFTTPTPGTGNPANPGTVTTQTEMFSLIEVTNTWRYWQSGDLGTAWRAKAYNDSTWPTGKALLGLETSVPFPYSNPILTPLKLTNASGAVPTYYFRTAFNVSTNLAGFTLETGIYVDDGAVFYLNGVEVGRLRISTASPVYATLASNQDIEGQMEKINIPVESLLAGSNTLAVEVHQSALTSSDVVFGMYLRATRVTRETNYNKLVINEVLANNVRLAQPDGAIVDWVELYNPSTNQVNLTGCRLTDNLGAPAKWVFPAGSFVGAGEYLTIRCDGDSAPAGVGSPILNTGFSLNAGGGAIYLFDAAGSLLDSIQFGTQAADYSIGRVPDATAGWVICLPTAGAENIKAAMGPEEALRINEWAADIPGSPDWLELFNPNNQPVALGGLYLTDKLGNRIKHEIAPLSFIGVGQNAFTRFIADNDTVQGPNHVAFSLDAAGEAIGLFPPGTAPAIDSVVFGIQATGVSQGRLPDGANTMQSFSVPSPGKPNWVALPNVVINEVLTHTDPPLEDAVELYNPSDIPVDISGWFLSDSADQLRKFHIPAGTVIPARGFKTFYEYEFNPDPLLPESFSFSSAKGDEVWLSNFDTSGAPTGYRAYAAFGPQFNGVGFGRVMTSVGPDFASMNALTFGTGVTAQSPVSMLGVFRTGAGALNSAPRVGPIVINEIMFEPALTGTNEDPALEYIELHNLSASTAPLFDPSHSTNGWKLRGGVDFDFNTSHSIPAGSYLLVVGFDPVANPAALTAFRSRYGNTAPIVGPWNGKLANSGEVLELKCPDNPDIDMVPYVTVDRVAYTSAIPWPTNANGTGLSIQRVEPGLYGNDPANWAAGQPSAGVSNGHDSDGDGMPDLWEIARGLNPGQADASADPDGDSYSNLREYMAGTFPLDPGSYLRISAVNATANGVEVHFVAPAGRTFSLVGSSALTGAPWETVASVPVQSAPVEMVITAPAVNPFSASRYYRLVTPASN